MNQVLNKWIVSITWIKF